MHEGDRSDAELRELAIKCRLLAAQVTDQSAAASLRNLTEEYEAELQSRSDPNPTGGLPRLPPVT